MIRWLSEAVCCGGWGWVETWGAGGPSLVFSVGWANTLKDTDINTTIHDSKISFMR